MKNIKKNIQFLEDSAILLKVANETIKKGRIFQNVIKY